MAALTRFSHLAADTIVNGAATSHLAPTDPADRKWTLVVGSVSFIVSNEGLHSVQGERRPFLWTVLGQRMWGLHPGLLSKKAAFIDLPFTPTGLMDTCRECGARALELVAQLQDQTMLPRAQPSLMRVPLQGILQLGQVRCAAKGLSVGRGDADLSVLSVREAKRCACSQAAALVHRAEPAHTTTLATLVCCLLYVFPWALLRLSLHG